MGTKAILTMLLSSAIVAGGCASIMHGSSQEMSFQSSPEDATVTVNGRVIGKTPITSRLDKKSGQAVVFSKDGYKPVTMQLTTQIDGWFWGNIVAGGFFGSTTDSINGSVDEYSPSQYFVTLTPVGATTVESSSLTSLREKVKQFIVNQHKNLLANISQSRGEELNTLMEMLMIAKDRQSDAILKIQALSVVYTDAPVFADQVIGLYVK